METILTLNKDYSNQAINLLFRGKVAREIIQATIHKMILLSEYDYFFDLQDKYNVTVTVNELVFPSNLIPAPLLPKFVPARLAEVAPILLLVICV